MRYCAFPKKAGSASRDLVLLNAGNPTVRPQFLHFHAHETQATGQCSIFGQLIQSVEVDPDHVMGPRMVQGLANTLQQVTDALYVLSNWVGDVSEQVAHTLVHDLFWDHLL